MKRLLPFLLLLIWLPACTPPNREAQIDDMLEAAFRYQFAKNGSAQQQAAAVYFLTILAEDGRTGRDPSDVFMQRFAGHRPRVARNSECTAGKGEGVRDRRTNEQGLIFRLGTIRWKSEDTAEVDGGYYEAGLSSSGNTYFLRRKNGKWTVEHHEMHWISQSPHQPPRDSASVAARSRSSVILSTTLSRSSSASSQASSRRC